MWDDDTHKLKGSQVDSATTTRGNSRIWRMPAEIPIFLVYLAIGTFLTWAVSAHPAGTIYGFPSDNLGQLWIWWWFRNAASFGAHASFSPLIGFPFGQHVPVITSEFLIGYGARLMLLFTGQAFVYNSFVVTSFLLSGITMYYLVRHITNDKAISFFGGLAYVLSIYHAVQASYSINLATTEWMPLFILVLLWFIKKPSPRNALFLVGSTMLVIGTSIHYGFFMAVFTVSFLLARFVYVRLSRRRKVKKGLSSVSNAIVLNKKTLVLALAIIVVTIVITLPLFLASQREIIQPGKWPTRPSPGSVRNEKTSAGGSASPWSYVLPERENRFLGWITNKIASGRVSFYTNSLYLGLSIMVPAIFAIVLIFRRRREDYSVNARPSDDQPEKPHGDRIDPPEGDRAIAWGLVFSAAVAFVLSLPPYFQIGSTRIPMPSAILEIIVPWLRWYMRFGAVVILCFIVLACLGLTWLKRSRGRLLTLALVAFLSIFLFFEMIIVPPFKYFMVNEKPPGVFESVASMEYSGGLVIYPAFEPGFFNSQRYMYYQQTFKKPMLNGAHDNTDGEALRRTVYNPYDPETPGILSRMGLNRVVYLDKLFEQYEGTSKADVEVTFLPPGLQLERRVKSSDEFGSGYIFKVAAPKADLVPIYQGDITVPHIDKGRVTVRLMERDGIIRIVNYTGKPMTARVRIPTSNLAFEHSLALTQGGQVLWRGKLSGSDSTVIEIPRLSVPADGTELHLVVGGAKLIISNDEANVFGTEYATLRIGNVKVEPESPK